jgi:transposase
MAKSHGSIVEPSPISLRSAAAAASAGSEGIKLSPPDPEVPAKAARRNFSAEYKQRILREADSCTEEGGIGALLRREGLYSSHLATWRRQRAEALRQALAPQQRGRRAAPHPLAEENEKLRRENVRLTERLQQAEIIIEVQKKISALLGNALPNNAHGEPT